MSDLMRGGGSSRAVHYVDSLWFHMHLLKAFICNVLAEVEMFPQRSGCQQVFICKLNGLLRRRLRSARRETERHWKHVSAAALSAGLSAF